jgi:hypothetical protein
MTLPIKSKFVNSSICEKNRKFFSQTTKNNMSARSPRGNYKVGPSRAQKPQCGPGEYAWRNFFGSGCKPASQDLRSEARQFRNVRGGAAPVQADGWYNGYNSYDNYDGLYGASSGRKSARRNYGSARRGYGSARRGYGSARRY